MWLVESCPYGLSDSLEEHCWMDVFSTPHLEREGLRWAGLSHCPHALVGLTEHKKNILFISKKLNLETYLSFI